MKDELIDDFPIRSSTFEDPEIKRQCLQFLNLPELTTILDVVPEFFLILNSNRQIVYANRNFTDFLKLTDATSIYGQLTGEALSCENVFRYSEGCGNTERCSVCGAVNAVLSSLKGEKDTREFRFYRMDTGEAYDFRVWCVPYSLNGEDFSLFGLTDISNEKRRSNLEEIFFHDILNTAGALRSFVEILKDENFSRKEEDNFKEKIYGLTEKLIDEIQAQKALAAAENNELFVNTSTINSLEIIKNIVEVYKNNFISLNKIIHIDPTSENQALISDNTLLLRILGNMLKNALEACNDGDVVTVGCKMTGTEIEFWMHNPNFIPKEVQLQIFQRSFSTKSAGRGLGTYSIRLLTEQYLNGSVGFVSSVECGTTFHARYPMVVNSQ